MSSDPPLVHTYPYIGKDVNRYLCALTIGNMLAYCVLPSPPSRGSTPFGAGGLRLILLLIMSPSHAIVNNVCKCKSTLWHSYSAIVAPTGLFWRGTRSTRGGVIRGSPHRGVSPGPPRGARKVFENFQRKSIKNFNFRQNFSIFDNFNENFHLFQNFPEFFAKIWSVI